MSNRKETPDLLGDILSPQSAAPAQTPTTPEATSEPILKPKRRKASTPHTTSSVSVQWAYREVIFREFRGWRPRYVDGEELKNWRDQPEIKEYLAILGADGWEMVGIMETKRNTRSIYFKRPLS